MEYLLGQNRIKVNETILEIAGQFCYVYLRMGASK